ncbi:hypothetical protein [Devosia sp.]|uniref:hypothetical protein n=1 Tax=Devosia sp. TaxID=1871048 RepID=UPI002EE14993
MQPTFILARDHLEQAASILRGADTQTQQLRNIVERTIALICEFEKRSEPRDGNVLDFRAYRERSHR